MSHVSHMWSDMVTPKPSGHYLMALTKWRREQRDELSIHRPAPAGNKYNLNNLNLQPIEYVTCSHMCPLNIKVYDNLVTGQSNETQLNMKNCTNLFEGMPKNKLNKNTN